MSIKNLVTLSLISVSLHAAPSLNEMEAKIDLLSKEVDRLKLKTSLIEGDVGFFNFLEPNGLQRVNTQSGFFYVSVSEVVPYEEGYKANIRIGNPFVAIFEDVTLHFIWGQKNEEKTESVELSEKIGASAWIHEEVFLKPLHSAEDLKVVGISIEVGRVELLKALES